MFVLAKWQHTSFNNVILFDPEINTLSGILVILYSLIILSGWLLVYLIPGLIWTLAFSENSCFKNKTRLFFQSFLISILLLFAGTSLFKIIARQSLNRVNFLGIILFLILAGLCLYSSLACRDKEAKKSITIKREIFLVVLAGIISMLLFIFIFRGKIFVENFSEGGIEVFYTARSLKSHLAPYGDLEANNRFGLPVSDPFWLISLLNLFNLLLFGESEGAVRLHFFIYLFMLYILLLSVFLNYKKKTNILYITIFIFLYLCILFFYAGHNAYFEDIAANVTIPLFTLLLYLGIYFLLNKDRTSFLIAALLSVLTLWSGIILIPIVLFAYWIYNKKKEFLKKAVLSYITMICILGLAYTIYGWLNGCLGIWHQSIKTEYLDELFFSPNKFSYILVFLKYFVIFAGGLPVLTLFFLKSKDRITNFFSLVTILYLLIVFKSSYINLHYFAPVIFLPMISFLRLTSHSKKINYFIFRGLLLLLLCALIIAAWPRKYFVHTIYRELGKKICMVFSSFKEAYDHRNITDLYFKDDMHFGHYIDIECLPYYADVTLFPKRDYDYYVTGNERLPKPGLKLLARGEGVYLFAQDFSQHIALNKIYGRYPLRKETSSILFQEIFQINSAYDDKKRNYIFY